MYMCVSREGRGKVGGGEACRHSNRQFQPHIHAHVHVEQDNDSERPVRGARTESPGHSAA